MPWRRQAGVTLAEMLITVAVLGMVAHVAIPNASPLTAFANDAATAEVLRAIRFAQGEAIRTGAWHTVKIDTSAQTLRVYRLTDSGAEDTTIPVLHPIDKKTYSLAFGAGGPARAVMSLVDFDYAGAGNTNLNVLGFRPDGTPALLAGSKAGDVKPLTAGVVAIQYGATQRRLVIDVVTGRVSG